MKKIFLFLISSLFISSATANANEVVINCTITSNMGVGGWQISLNQQSKKAHARFLGAANAWTSITASLLDQTFELHEQEAAEGSFYNFGVKEGSYYEVFVINRGNMQIRFASSQTGATDWGNCRHAPKGL
jgi:hypothetical protein